MRFAIMLALSGCNLMFPLEENRPAPPGDATGGEQIIVDARANDAAILGDGRVCWDPALVVHDEDMDGIKDGCDNCPAVVNILQSNLDSDDLGDACDPHPNAIDTIVYWPTVKTMSIICRSSNRWRSRAHVASLMC